jgi:hypothetical protein
MDQDEVWGDNGGWQWDAGHKNAIRLRAARDLLWGADQRSWMTTLLLLARMMLV